ncbi:hypothetical protein Tsubulata_008170 [Turnera subulata]|uniref:Alliinase C-terminal domain-containing protein n=1 Tax=Turnera subulata TaxID=218843 RepID=A0A9Q0GKJ9_9ROSI|nr:hypothetical protein Tsubulata_008170 [Turnera subulata]
MWGKQQIRVKYLVVVVCCLVCSVILNVYYHFKAKNEDERLESWEGSWSRAAAIEAEGVAAIRCSGHGRAYLDGWVVDDDDEGSSPVCECHSCYGGPDCSQFFPSCSANADGGDPLFLEPFWIERAASSAVVVAGWHRMSYQYSDESFISKQLEKHIRKLHSIVGNAVTQGRYIVFGTGSTQLLNAAVRALALPDDAHNYNASPPAPPFSVLATIPFYPVYELQSNLFHSVDFKFEGDTSSWKNSSDPASSKHVIEFITSPNNPDGQLHTAVLSGPNVKPIYDHAYYWPHFTAIPAPADADLMIFTLSKLTGHAGSRFGWSLIKDEVIYQRMIYYMTLSSMGVSRDSQLRVLKLLKVVLDKGGRDIFEFGHHTMRGRWQKLSNIISMSKRFSLQKIPPKYCNFFKKNREASPAYAWLKCERKEDKDCFEVLEAANITGRRGSMFYAGDRHVRLSLIRNQDDFDLLLHKLQSLVSEEDGPETI